MSDQQKTRATARSAVKEILSMAYRGTANGAPEAVANITDAILRAVHDAERAVAPAGAEPSDVLRFSGDRFPLQTAEGRPKSVPWVMVAPHEQQAQANHGQSLQRLAERHGLDPQELWCVVHDQPWDRRPRPEYCDAWLSGINDLRIALVVAAQAVRAAASRAAPRAALTVYDLAQLLLETEPLNHRDLDAWAAALLPRLGAASPAAAPREEP